MDQELIIYLDRRFENLDARLETIDTRFEGIDSQFQEIGQKFDRIDQRFDNHEQRFDNHDHGIQENGRQIHQLGLLVEGLRSDIRTVAEGVTSLNQKMDHNLEGVEAGHRADQKLDRGAHRRLRKRVDTLEGRVHRIEAK